jgi:putative endonuclease
MFFVYVLQSEKSGQYYIGHSDNPERRLKEHNETIHNTFTSKHRPWKLIAQFPIGEERSKAMQVEKYIKRRKSRSLIETIILKEGDLAYIEKLKLLSSAG